MLDIYVVDDPRTGGPGQERLPILSLRGRTYNEVSSDIRRDMVTFCSDLQLHKERPICSGDSLLVFLHGSNSEASRTKPLRGASDWPSDCQLIAYISLRVCQIGGRVVVFSGGQPSSNMPQLRQLLKEHGYEEGRHFALAYVTKINQEHPDIQMDHIPKSWRVERLIHSESSVQSVVPVLSAFDILSQGYLAIWAPELVFGPAPEAFLSNCGIEWGTGSERRLKGREATVYRSPSDQALFRPWGTGSLAMDEKQLEPEDLGKYWFDECLPDVATREFGDLLEMCPILANANSLRKLWELLRGECLGSADGRRLVDCSYSSQADVTALILGAHREYRALFEGGPRVESARKKLNHDRLKNEFVHVILSGSSGSPPDERLVGLSVYLDYLANQQASDREDKADSVRQGLESWGKIEQEIRQFLTETISDHGFTPTPLGAEAIEKFLHQDTGWLATVRGFIAAVPAIANASAAQRKPQLKKLVSALDGMTATLANMAFREDSKALFGGYLAVSESEVKH